MKLCIFSLLSILVAVNAGPLDTDPTVRTEAVPVNHISNYSPRFTTEEIKGSIGCTERKNLFFTDRWVKLAEKCVTPELWGPEEGKRDVNCKFFCQGYSVGILDESGYPTKASYDRYLDLAVPEEHRAKAKEIVHECLKTMVDRIDLDDPKCEGAGQFNKCIFGIFKLSC